MEVLRKYKKQLFFHLLLNLVFGVFVTFSSYYHLPLATPSDYLVFGLHFIVLQFTIFGFLYLLSLNKYIFLVLFPLIFLVLALFSYWVYSMDLSVTDAVIHAVIETQPDIAFDLITLPFILYIFLVLTGLIILINQYLKISKYQLKSPLVFLALIGVLSYFVVEHYRSYTFNRRLPYSMLIGIGNYLDKPKIKIAKLSKKVYTEIDSLTIIFILGESVRADHLQLNGYPRRTNPLLSERENLISFPKVYTPLTYTGVSVPQILTNASITGKKPEAIHSIYTLLNQLNFNTTWIGNQSPERSYSKFIEENKNIQLIDQYRSSLSFNKKLDEELLPYLDNALLEDGNKFITLHMIGSHWWYENRYNDNFRKFKPIIKGKHIPSLTGEEIVNSYDNTLLYMDYFLNEVIKKVEYSQQKALVLFVSDHGEILGEDGKWLHAQQSDATQNPAVLVWYSDSYKNKYPNLVKYLHSKSGTSFSTDFFFHSIMEALQVQDYEYDKSKSIFAD